MTFLIGAANSLTGAYEVTNSVRFRSAGSSQMSQGNGTPTSSKKMTWSAWVKTGKNFEIDSETTLYSATGGGGNGANITFSNDALKFQSDTGNSGTDFAVFFGNPARQFRDPAAWYHIVCALDTTQGTAANRNKIYVNGVQQEILAGNTNATQDDDYDFTSARDSALGKNITSNGNYFDGYMSEIHLIDGQQLTPASFGETNSNGVWVPIEYSGTFGNNGWYIPGSSNTTDSSGNGNNFGQSNTVITTDTPTNNFATLNPLNYRLGKGHTFSEGNLQVTTGTSGGSVGGFSTIAGLKRGKWYAEFKPTVVGTSGAIRFGIEDTDFVAANGLCNVAASAYASNGNKGRNATDTSHGDSFDDDDIIGVAVDLDNGAIYFAKNGTWQNSSDPESGASKTGAAYTDILTILPAGGYMFAFNLSFNNSQQENVQVNFGVPGFTVSSGNADGNGYGDFEFAVPSGYYSLCTKNLAEFG